MTDHIFAQRMDYIFFFYGASFIALGAVCFSILRRSGGVKVLPWYWLGLFGFVHGLNEWMDMIAISLASFANVLIFDVVRFLVLVTSFIFLMEFGRRGTSVIWQKKIGPGFYAVPLILLLVGSRYGWPGINATARYGFGLVSGIWSAFILLSYRGSEDKPLTKLAAILLRLAGVFMFLYGLTTGLVVPEAGFFPSNIINVNTFAGLFHLPVQFFRGIFAFIIATSIAIYAVKRSIVDFFKEERIKERRFVGSSITVVISIFLLFGVLAEVVEHYATRVERDEMYTRKLKAKMFVEFVDMTIARLQPIQALATNPAIIATLQASQVTNDGIMDAHERLDRYRHALDADVCYIMDKNGLTVASTNRNTPKSFVGKNYSFRPYFQEAIRGRNNVYLAEGVTSKERGIYVSYPVASLETREHQPIFGVTVAKANIDELENTFRTYPYVFLISPEGVIFISSKPEWVFKSIKDFSAEEKEALMSSRQFGSGPWESVGFEKRDDVKGKVYFKNKLHYFATETIKGLSGWQIFFMEDSNSVANARFTLIMIFLSLFLLMLIISLFIFRIYLDKLHIGASEALYEALVEGSPDSIKLFNREGRCISINKTGLEMMDWKKEDVLGKTFEELWPGESREKLRRALWGVLEGKQQSFEAKRLRKDGVVLIESVTMAPIFEVSGNIKYFITIVRDVTEERRARERLMQSSKMASIGALATGVSHEFNNVLEIILGNAELAYASEDAELMKKTLNVIIDSTRRAAWIVRSMLDFTGKATESREPVDLNILIRQNLLLLNKIFEADTIDVETYFKDVPRVYGNPGQLSQAFVNIMMNARDAMQGHGLKEKKITITLDYDTAAAEVLICFKDTGIGIKEEIKNKLFGPFVTTKGILGGGEDKQPGVGLSLFVAYGIIKQHHGDIIVESEEGKGAKFCVSLPVFKEENPDKTV